MTPASIVKKLENWLPHDPPLYVLAAIVLVLATALGMVLPLLPLYATHLEATPAHLGALISLYLAGQIVAQIPAGYLSDRLGSAWIIKIGVGLFMFVSIGYASSHRVTTLLIWRFIHGLASGGALVAVRSYTNTRISRQERGIANALVTSAYNGGELLGPVCGGLLADRYNYQTPFVILAICIGVLLPFVAFLPHNSCQGAAKQADNAPIKATLHTILSLLRDRLIVLLSGIRFAEMGGFAIWLTVFAPYASAVMQWDATRIGFAFSVAAGAGLITGPVWGILSDRLGRRPVLIAGLLMLLLQVTFVLVFPHSTFIWVAFALGGAGGTGYFDALFALIGDVTVEKQNTGQAMGLIGSVSDLGSVFSPWLASMVWKLWGIHTPLLINILFLLVALGLVLNLATPATVTGKI